VSPQLIFLPENSEGDKAVTRRVRNLGWFRHCVLTFAVPRQQVRHSDWANQKCCSCVSPAH